MFAEMAAIYRASVKSRDIAWNRFVARPVAAAALVLLRRTPITPNQLSFLGLFMFMGVPATLIAWPGDPGFLVAALLVELAYVVDCADGQLARLKSMSSEIGAHLDFFIDEIKALLLVAGCAVRLWLQHEDPLFLLTGIGSILTVAISTSLTTFVRRPEYAGREIKPGTDTTGPDMPDGAVPRAVWLLLKLLRLLVHYPSWILLIALAGLHPSLDAGLLFFALYMGVYVLYMGRTSLGIFVRLAHPGFYRDQGSGIGDQGSGSASE